jgi:hypothetical protein
MKDGVFLKFVVAAVLRFDVAFAALGRRNSGRNWRTFRGEGMKFAESGLRVMKRRRPEAEGAR